MDHRRSNNYYFAYTRDIGLQLCTCTPFIGYSETYRELLVPILLPVKGYTVNPEWPVPQNTDFDRFLLLMSQHKYFSAKAQDNVALSATRIVDSLYCLYRVTSLSMWHCCLLLENKFLFLPKKIKLQLNFSVQTIIMVQSVFWNNLEILVIMTHNVDELTTSFCLQISDLP